MRRPLRGEHVAQRLLGAGLADGAGDGCDLRARPGAGGDTETAKGREHRIGALGGHGEQRGVASLCIGGGEAVAVAVERV